MVTEDLVSAQRKRALTPDLPVLRGTAQNPDCFFQAREACNPYYDACAGKVQEAMDALREADRPRLPASSTTSATRRPSASSSSWARAPT